MSDLDISSGSAIAIDTETLRAAAVKIGGVVDQLDEAAGLARRAQAVLPHGAVLVQQARERLHSISCRAAEHSEALRGVVDRLDATAALYDLVELRAARDAAAQAGDRTTVERLDAQLAALRADWPDMWDGALTLEARHHAEWLGRADLMAARYAWALAVLLGSGGLAVPIGAGLMFMLHNRTGGLLPRDARLSGPDPAVAVRRVSAPKAGSAPASLEAVAERMPGGTETRVRVEKYTMPDGTRQFAVYITGTQSMWGDDPWDLPADLELDGGRRSASYEATVDALRDAGAGSDDVVHVAGHSQGAMIANRLALEGEFDVRSVITFGSPVEADLPSDTLSISVRHNDDAVALLAEGGFAQQNGSADSFVATRTVDPSRWGDLILTPHHMSAYEETAREIDASGDPHTAGMRDLFAQLGTATSVEVTEYGAERVHELTPRQPQPYTMPQASEPVTGASAAAAESRRPS